MSLRLDGANRSTYVADAEALRIVRPRAIGSYQTDASCLWGTRRRVRVCDSFTYDDIYTIIFKTNSASVRIPKECGRGVSLAMLAMNIP